MKSFRDYIPNDNTESVDGENVETLGKKLAEQYNGKSSNDMWRNILAEAEKSKRAGTLTNEEIENFYQSFAPMLDNTQRSRLRSVVEKLKKI